MPSKDILFIYKIFFQLINNSITEIENTDEFWESCRKYFINNTQGNIGKLMEDIIKNNEVNLSGKNLYRIYKLTNNKLNKINPGNFSRLCETTGLFTFFIKDILEYLGFSESEIKQRNGYFTYKKISEFLDNIVNDVQKKLCK